MTIDEVPLEIRERALAQGVPEGAEFFVTDCQVKDVQVSKDQMSIEVTLKLHYGARWITVDFTLEDPDE